MEHSDPSTLASHQRCVERILAAWPAFRATCADRLRHGNEAEKVAEGIIEALFTQVLDWTPGDLMYQIAYADIVVSRNLAKYLVIEVKRPGTLFPGRRALEAAVAQARRYADEQKVRSVAATDGRYFYAADIQAGGLIDRALVDLTATDPPLTLWQLSIHGIYRPPTATMSDVSIMEEVPDTALTPPDEALLHPRYRLPATCFAYAPDTNRPATWKLPYRLSDGTVDSKRLPKAIQAILSNYRGTKVGGIPESDMLAVLRRLADAAAIEGRMPPRALAPAPIYQQLAQVLEQLGLSASVS